MKQLAIVSGKGGTGKTTVVASLAQLARPAAVADCDVDAANLALLLPNTDGPEQAFYAGGRAEIKSDLCDGCGSCLDVCRFDAIHFKQETTAAVDPLACEGCGACRSVCPTEAIAMYPNQAGVWMLRDTECGPLVHARLGIAQSNSGKLVAQVREEARKAARERGLDLVLIDGPPGIGCPVHAAIAATDLLLVVTEPTPSGEHDLQRILRLAQTFKLQAAVLINKADLSDQYVERIEQLSGRFGVPIVGRLPFHTEVPRLLAQGRLPLGIPSLSEELQRVWRKLGALMANLNSEVAQGGA